MKWLRSLPLLLCMVFALLHTQSASAQVNFDCTGNESWISAGGGVSGEALAAAIWNGELYVIHRTDVPPSELAGDVFEHRLSKLSGGVWTEVATFPVEFLRRRPPLNNIPVLFPYNGSLYMGGIFTMVDGVAGTQGLARWDGSSWNAALPNTLDVFFVQAMEEYNGDLYIMAAIDQGQPMALLRGDGTNWSQILTGYWLFDMAVWKGELYAGGYIYELGPDMDVGFAKWNGSKWTRLLDTTDWRTHVHKILPYKNGLFLNGWLYRGVREWGEFAQWDGNYEVDLPTQFFDPPRDMGSVAMVEYMGEIYVTSLDSVRENSPPGTSINGRWDGTQWHTVTNVATRINFMIVFNGVLYAGGYITNSCGTPIRHIAQLCNDQTCSRISGRVYYDENNNCVQDGGESGRKHRIIEISPGSTYAMSDEAGNYSQYVDPGTYTVGMRPFPHWDRTCPADPGTYTVTLAKAGESATDNDFAIQPVPGIQDLRISTVVGVARQGRQLVYAITYENAGTVTMNGTVRLFHDPILRFDSANAPATRYTPNVVEWDFTNLKMEESRTIKVYTTVSVATPVGTDICSRVEIDPQSNNFGIDNRDSICTEIVGSYDPNDISVTPYGIEDDGVIAPEDNLLTYHVRFQNTGNDTAFKVVVTDQLNPNLDIASIRLGAASHPYSFEIDKNNTLIWTFDNILLPDSNASEINSHGFFKFSVNMKPNLPPGTDIPNNADIYFDYNAPVRTNTVISILGTSLGVDPVEMPSALYLYPNPARDLLHLDGELRADSELTLRNLLGETVLRQWYQGRGPLTIDLSALPAGTYLLEAVTSKGVAVQRIAIVK